MRVNVPHAFIYAPPLATDCDSGLVVFYDLQEAKAVGSVLVEARLEAQMHRLQATAESFVVPNAYGALLQQYGAANFNASTTHVCIQFIYILTSMKYRVLFGLIGDLSMSRFRFRPGLQNA